MKRLMKWPLLCGLLSLTLTRATLAADALFQNDGVITYPGTEVYPPVVDATNFVNTGTFVVNFTTVSLTQPFYETSDTLNYTNTGVMMGNLGFQFDNRSSVNGEGRTPSANFYNQGSISTGSTANTTDVFGGLLGLGLSGFFPQCFVYATNIVSPGAFDVGVDGLVQLAGQNIDLSAGSISVEGAGANPFGLGAFGYNTNFWDPSVFLGPTHAESSPPFVFLLPNSTAYFNIKPGSFGIDNVIQAVFIEDDSATNDDFSLSQNVYFHTDFNPVTFGTVTFGIDDFATVEWVGSYRDVASGSFFKSYLYLDDDYDLAGNTNLLALSADGFPNNFTFRASSVPVPTGVLPAQAGFQNVFSAGSVTNLYAYEGVQLIGTTVSTNLIVNQSITNLPGRILISAGQTLNLAATHITGPNYLSVQSPNQFDGSPGALIESPFSDINVGVTNGLLMITNLISPQVPTWRGNVQAWTTSWTGTNAGGGTNLYEVLIVGSALNPTTRAQVQDLFLHSVSNIVVSDTLNIMRNFNADAQNLTLTTNGLANGATSLDGELNLESGQIFWSSSLPNLRNLTNNGAIRSQNLIQFIGSSNNVVVTPGTNAVAATGKLSEIKNSNVVKGSTVNLGTNQYVFVSKLTNALPGQVMIAGNLDGSLNNLIAAINRADGAGTAYSSNTPANPFATAGPLVTAGLFTNHSFTVTALASGADGNLIRTTNTSVSLAWNGLKLSGGTDAVPGTTNVTATALVPYQNLVNRGLLSDQGSTIWVNNFENYGAISNNGVGSFSVDSLTTTLTNSSITAGGDISISAGSLVASNVVFQSGRSVTLRVTNLLTDCGITNGSVWSVQTTNGPGGNALIMPVKPVLGDLLGTTITNYAPPPNRQSVNVWAGENRGISASGFTNNAAIGRLYLDALGSVSQFRFSGAGVSNALYVDDLEFRDAMTNGIDSSFDFSVNLSISPGMMIYFAQATTADGTSIAAKIDAASKAGRNGGRLRWVPGYAGHFSSINVIYPDGTTNTVNAALAGSTTIDSNGNGIPNGSDPAPFFTGSQVGLSIATTNAPASAAIIRWNSIPGSTNYVYYKTNLASTTWLTLTNFVSPAVVPPAGGWPITNTVFDAVNSSQTRFYNVTVSPNSASLYGQ